jgi:hypothetical protein
MIDQCDSSVASWTTDGESFIIRDVEEFAKVRTKSHSTKVE